jgi:flagellar operon protein
MTSNTNINNILIPNVSKLPKHSKVSVKDQQKVSPDEFKNLLNDHVSKKPVQKEKEIQLSVHAAKRLKERNLEMDSSEFFKLKSAFKKLQEKGGQDSLVITDKAAYIVDVSARKVVTAIDKGSIADNVFTKIDSTVMV